MEKIKHRHPNLSADPSRRRHIGRSILSGILWGLLLGIALLALLLLLRPF